MLIYGEKCNKYCFNFTDTVLQMCQHHVSNISITMNIYVQLTFLILKKLNVMACIYRCYVIFNVSHLNDQCQNYYFY
jgi:hypothetical protein